MKNSGNRTLTFVIMLVYFITSTGIVLGFSACPCSGQESVFLNRSDYTCFTCLHDHHCHTGHNNCESCHHVDHIYVKNETEHNIAIKIKLTDPGSFSLSLISHLYFVGDDSVSIDEKKDKGFKIPLQRIIPAHILSRTYPSEDPLS